MRQIVKFFGRHKGPATLKREFALAAFVVWVLASFRIFCSADPVWIQAQGVNYATLTTTIWLFITASVGIQAWQNQTDNQTTVTTTTPAPPEGGE